MTYKERGMRIEQHDSRPIAIVRRRASLQELARVVPDACGMAWSLARAENIPGVGRLVALYLDGEINLEVGVELGAPYDKPGELVGSAIPGGLVATAIHLGPYQRLHETHQAIHQWCKDRGQILAGPNWEIYDHWRDEWNHEPAMIRTDVFYLLKVDPG